MPHTSFSSAVWVPLTRREAEVIFIQRGASLLFIARHQKPGKSNRINDDISFANHCSHFVSIDPEIVSVQNDLCCKI